MTTSAVWYWLKRDFKSAESSLDENMEQLEQFRGETGSMCIKSEKIGGFQKF